MTTPGKVRHLAQCSSDDGHFCIVAIDHRANLRAALDRAAPAALDDAAFVAFKADVLRHLLAPASAVLVDPVYGLGPGLAEHLIPGGCGILAPLEVTNYDVPPAERETVFIPGWSVGKLKRVGCTGVKLLLYYHPADARAAAKRDLVTRVAADCAAHDIPFFLEPIVYPPDPAQPLSAADHRAAVLAAVRDLGPLGVDVLKLEFPCDIRQEPGEIAWEQACAAVTAASPVPWALLSGGGDYETFRRQAAVACAAGASGIIAGRALWGEAVALHGEARARFLATTGRARVLELAALVRAQARDWRQVTPAPALPSGWHAGYAEG